MLKAQLVWIKSKNIFLKVQEGVGDNLSSEDINKGYVDYCLWSTFKPECIDIDGELDMECLDSGEITFKESFNSEKALRDSYEFACGKKYNACDIVVLVRQ